MDADRQWFKSSSGLDSTQSHRNDSFCAYTVLPEFCDVFVVPDAQEDARFSSTNLVLGPPFIRFYAGASLLVAGVKVGSLCIIDTKPRHDFSIDQRLNLLDLGEAVANLLRERRDNNLRAQKDRSNIMTDLMHNIRTPLMSLVIASSILERDQMIRSSQDTENFDNCVHDVVTAVKEIQVQVENTLTMSAAFVANDVNQKDLNEQIPSPSMSPENESTVTLESQYIDILKQKSNILPSVNSIITNEL